MSSECQDPGGQRRFPAVSDVSKEAFLRKHPHITNNNKTMKTETRGKNGDYFHIYARSRAELPTLQFVYNCVPLRRSLVRFPVAQTFCVQLEVLLFMVFFVFSAVQSIQGSPALGPTSP